MLPECITSGPSIFWPYRIETGGMAGAAENDPDGSVALVHNGAALVPYG